MRSAGEKPADLAFVSEGLQFTNRSAEMERRRVPRWIESPAGFVGLDRSAAYGCSPQPSGLPEPAGRFHRGATRGEMGSRISGGVEACART